MNIAVDSINVVMSLGTISSVVVGCVWIGRKVQSLQDQLKDRWTLQNQMQWQMHTEQENKGWRGADPVVIHGGAK